MRPSMPLRRLTTPLMVDALWLGSVVLIDLGEYDEPQRPRRRYSLDDHGVRSGSLGDDA